MVYLHAILLKYEVRLEIDELKNRV